MSAIVSLTGPVPFSSFAVPGVEPSLVVGRRPQLIDGDAEKALKAALKAKSIPGVTADDVAIESVKAAAKE